MLSVLEETEVETFERVLKSSQRQSVVIEMVSIPSCNN